MLLANMTSPSYCSAWGQFEAFYGVAGLCIVQPLVMSHVNLIDLREHLLVLRSVVIDRLLQKEELNASWWSVDMADGPWKCWRSTLSVCVWRLARSTDGL